MTKTLEKLGEKLTMCRRTHTIPEVSKIKEPTDSAVYTRAFVLAYNTNLIVRVRFPWQLMQ